MKDVSTGQRKKNSKKVDNSIIALKQQDTIFFQIYMDAPPGIPGVSKNQNLKKKIKVLSSCPLGSQNIKNRGFRFELFSVHLPLW